MKEIPLTQGYVALIDDEDYELVSQYKWHVEKHVRNSGSVYFYASKKNVYGVIRMHTFILNAQAGQEVDHKDRNGLNNQRSNLRFAPNGLNSANGPLKGRNRINTSKYRGVYWNKAKKRWRAGIAGHYLGLFKTEEEAARRYDEVAKDIYDEFATLNFPDQ